ncbi:MAG: polysaccharide biosynthesis/export family protein [Croceibacterium sp.]
MTYLTKRLCAAVIGALALAGCQPALHSDLPVGPAAYESIGASQVPAPAGAYLLRAGDKLSVDVFQEKDLSKDELQVDEAGMITLPLIGELQAAGLSSTQLSREIEQAYGRRYLRNPQATVVLKLARPRTVSVEGQVQRPGVYEIQPGYSLLSAMALAGSPSVDAKLNEVLVFRTIDGTRMGGRFDLTEVRAGRMPDPQLVPGDIVVVGFSSIRGIYRDILQAAPLFGAFVTLGTSGNRNNTSTSN